MYTVRLWTGSFIFAFGIAFWVWFLRNLFRRKRVNQALLFTEYNKTVQIIFNSAWVILGLWIYPIPETMPLLPLIIGILFGIGMSR